MKFFNRNFQSRLLGAILAIAPAVAGLSSCGMVNDDLDPCPEGINLRFVYDYNMEFANAFPSQVHCLTVYVYDENGKYLLTRTETSEEKLSDENYRMTIDLPEGKYKVIAYGGMECSASSYHFLQTPSAGSDLIQLGVALNQSIMDRETGTELHPLFYGNRGQVLEVEVKESSMTYDEYTVYMMKDTNNLRVVLQELNGDPVDNRDFNWAVIDDNTLMNWANDVVPTSPFTYLPWTQGTSSPGLLPDGSESKVAYAEFSFGRLVTSNTPTLLITRRSDGSDVVNIPLINYLALLKSESLHQMSTQEYLDRESRWSMIFFLDRHWKWIYVQIQVNDWVVRINNPAL
ncbi:MAG: FimB/Mfa2 family fimbrial subunit [Muribaculaceae bacterium]|nr:FimB/Mfa2 family fimbrial subunit [Muribaculaceae bacterium]